MAARGTRNMDTGEEKIDDSGLVERLRARSKKINRRALITAIIVTIVALLFPSP